MKIRPETRDDVDEIRRLTKTAFEPMPYSDGNEAECLDTLRADGDLIWSLVASDADRLLGHVAFSPVFLNGRAGNWFGLGPVSVWPDLQKRGIGSALILDGIGRLKTGGAAGCVLIGDPAYYGRFGFTGDGRITYRDLPSAVVQWLAFADEKPSGVLTYSRGLEL